MVSAIVRSSTNEFSEYSDSDIVINRVHGRTEHVGLAWQWQFKNGFFLGLNGEQGQGELLWEGYDQSFQYTEYTTEYFLNHNSIHFGHNFRHYSSYIGFGHRYRERNIVGGDLYEELNWDYASLGTDWRLQLSERWRVTFLWELAVALQSEQKVEYANKYETTVIQPGRLASGTVGLELSLNPSDSFSVSISPLYDFTLIGKGESYALFRNGQKAAFNLQPKTIYETISWQLNLNWLF